MATFLVESYTPSSRADEDGTATRLASVAAELAREGVQVEHRRTIFLAADDTCFYLVEASSVDEVDELCRRAGLAHARIVLAVET